MAKASKSIAWSSGSMWFWPWRSRFSRAHSSKSWVSKKYQPWSSEKSDVMDPELSTTVGSFLKHGKPNSPKLAINVLQRWSAYNWRARDGGLTASYPYRTTASSLGMIVQVLTATEAEALKLILTIASLFSRWVQPSFVCIFLTKLYLTQYDH